MSAGTLPAVRPETLPQRSYRDANLELAVSFERYLIARGRSQHTIRAYRSAVDSFVEFVGSGSISGADRTAVRLWLTKWLKNGVSQNSVRLHTQALRAFFKFIVLSGLTKHDPMQLISYRRIPRRLPRVLAIEDIERLIAAARDPFERAVVEVLYSTGVRVSELVNLRLADIAPGHIMIRHGKGDKDRIVLYGRACSKAIAEYLAWRPSNEFLFEAPARDGSVFRRGRSWYARLYVDAVQRHLRVGKVADLPTEADARKEFDRITEHFPGFIRHPKRPYPARAIRLVLDRLACRAGVDPKLVHPHAFRRAMASHMLSRGGDLRCIQQLLGHTSLSTTMLYVSLDPIDLKRVHERCHPHERSS